MSKNDFKFISMLGAGSFGKVYKVSFVENEGLFFAMKVLSKNQL